MLGIVVSREDPAALTIAEQLHAIADWSAVEDDDRPDAAGGGTVYRTDGARLREFDGRHLDLERPAAAFAEVDVLVFPSKHAGETGRLLTAHHTGNFGPADHGGESNELAQACPNVHARALELLETYAPTEYDVGMECTHHGPTDVGAPSLFVEVGSSQAEWEEPAPARAVARTILDLRGEPPYRRPVGSFDTAGNSPDRSAGDGPADEMYRRHLVGFGGGHYAPRFERVCRETDWAIGHIAADWGLDSLGDLTTGSSRAVLRQAFSTSRAAYALVDGDRPAVEQAVVDAGFHPVSETWVRETNGIDLGFVRAAEETLGTVAEGLRFGAEAQERPADWVVRVLPTAILEEAANIDPAAALEALAERSLAYRTAENGTRPTGAVMLREAEAVDDILGAFEGILGQRYDTLERREDELLARVSAFDPERARTIGVPEGPAFGRLADGEPVEVDGETIPPSVVHTVTERSFSLEAEPGP